MEVSVGVDHRELLIEIVHGDPLIVLGFELTTNKAKSWDDSACVEFEIADVVTHALLYLLVEQIVDAVAQLSWERLKERLDICAVVCRRGSRLGNRLQYVDVLRRCERLEFHIGHWLRCGRVRWRSVYLSNQLARFTCVSF